MFIFNTFHLKSYFESVRELLIFRPYNDYIDLFFSTVQMSILTLQHDKSLGNQGTIRFNTLPDATYWAEILAKLTPNPTDTYFGLCELFINSIIHGINKKQQRNHTYVHVDVDITHDSIIFDIKDDGDGFDWCPFLELDDKRIRDKNGRGIALTRHISFDDVTYLGKGNHVRCLINLPPKEGGA